MDSSVDERENPSTGQAAQHQDDVVMEEADELPRADLSYVAQERDNELDPNTKNGSSHHVQDEHDSEEPLGAESQNERGLESQPSAKSRRFPIEIVLNPPTDPSAYQRIEPSQTVERILEEIELDGDIFYSVEFDDGRIEQVSGSSSSSLIFNIHRWMLVATLFPYHTFLPYPSLACPVPFLVLTQAGEMVVTSVITPLPPQVS
ncbi:hypothetical protein F5Y05DRAFT_111374 [Hypoxylon sp. FL0543]|nr:hypothetical protein F5Y05DRAFT_111374 [Hypoxylon sp. FL0543]